MEITGIVGQGGPHRSNPGEFRAQRSPTQAEQTALRAEQNLSSVVNETMEVETLVKDLQIVTSALDKRLKFSINQELNQIVVKVIDRQTDKVIKELPPEEIQRLHVRIREAIGLLIDEEI
ncbi:MAG: flagellar protein FlaG [Spirochaetota bacterium]